MKTFKFRILETRVVDYKCQIQATDREDAVRQIREKNNVDVVLTDCSCESNFIGKEGDLRWTPEFDEQGDMTDESRALRREGLGYDTNGRLLKFVGFCTPEYHDPHCRHKMKVDGSAPDGGLPT